jgi:hypothetical protein
MMRIIIESQNQCWATVKFGGIFDRFTSSLEAQFVSSWGTIGSIDVDSFVYNVSSFMILQD